MKTYLPLRIVTGVVCLYCVGMGLGLNGSQSMVAGMAERFLGYDLPEGSPLIFAARMIGVYMAFFGVTMGLVAWRPVQNRALLSAGAVLLVVRVVQRLATFDELQQTFGLTPGRNLAYVITVAVLAVLLLAFRILLVRDMRTGKTS
jgi:hypothetical protein